MRDGRLKGKVFLLLRNTPLRSMSKYTEPSGLIENSQSASVAMMPRWRFTGLGIFNEMMAFEIRYRVVPPKIARKLGD